MCEFICNPWAQCGVICMHEYICNPIRMRELMWVNVEQCACASLSAILRSNARARTDMQPAGSTHGNARA